MRSVSDFRLYLFLTSLTIGLATTFSYAEDAPASHLIKPKSLADTGRRILSVVKAHEETHDATCWSTVGMMEEFYSGQTIAEHARLLKAESMKNLLYILWRAASLRSQTETLAAADVDRVVPGWIETRLVAFPTPAAINTPEAKADHVTRSIAEYNVVTEHKRTLLALVYEQLGGDGEKNLRGDVLKPLDESAIARFSEVLAVVAVELLQKAAVNSRRNQHKATEPGDIASAYQELAGELHNHARARIGLVAPGIKPTPDSGALRELTAMNLDNKVRALAAWNKQPFVENDFHTGVRESLSSLLPLPLDQRSYGALLAELNRFSSFVAAGLRSMRADGFAPTSVSSERPTKGYLDLQWVATAIDELFPVEEQTNGDVVVQLAPIPSLRKSTTGADEIRTVVLRGFDLDAVRDTTLHWLVLSESMRSETALPIEPFAAELFAERVSQLALLIVREADRSAKADGRFMIEPRDIGSIFSGKLYAVSRKGETEWPKELVAHKAELLKRYTAPLFKDITAASGLSPRTCPLTQAVAQKSSTQESATQKSNVVASGQMFSPQDLVNIQRYMGSGIAVGDLDGDNLPELFVSGNDCNRLYRNRGGYVFEDITATSGISDSDTDSRQALFVDVDNDSKLDLFVVHSDSLSRLFLQQPTGEFLDLTAASGISTGVAAHSAFFFDYDNDGLLDLYVGHYGKGQPTLGGRNGEPNQLYRNLGGGRFRDVSEEAGVASNAWTLAGLAFDYDHDGYTDFLLANDFGEDELFRNLGNGRFREVGEALGVNDRGAGMNVSVTDLNRDGFLDPYISVIDMFSKSLRFVMPTADSIVRLDDRILHSSFSIAGNKLFLAQEKGPFRAVESEVFEPGDRGWGWSANFFDYENDGDDDMYLANGWIKGSYSDNQPNQFFLQDQEHFFQYSVPSPESFPGNSRAVAAVDLTNSGRIDLVVTGLDEPIRVLANQAAPAGRWLKVRLVGVEQNRFGVGALVRVFAAGLQPVSRLVSSGSNYLSQDDTTLNFGLGASEKVDRIVVNWPGKTAPQIHTGPFDAGTVVTIREAEQS